MAIYESIAEALAATAGGGTGDVVGPAGATANAVVRFDSTTGKLVKNSVVTISNTGTMAGIADLSATGSIAADILLSVGSTYVGDQLSVAGAATMVDVYAQTYSLSDGASQYLEISLGDATLSTSRALYFTVNDANRTINMGGNITTAGAFITSGANSLTLTTSGATNVTLPTTGTVLSSASSAGGDLGGTYPNPTVTDLTIASEAQGDILYRNATNWVRLAAGTSGHFLKTQGAAANPIWDAAGSGDVVGPASATANAVARFSGTGGKTIKNSGIVVDDSDNITGVVALTATGAVSVATGSLILPNGAALVPTTDASIGWDSDDNLLKIGTGGATKTFVDLDSTQTIAAKTLTAPVISAGTIAAITSFGIRSTGSGAFDLLLDNTENLTANRTLTITLNNAARTVNIGGNITTTGNFTTAGSNNLVLTTTGTTNVTLPTSGTVLSSASSAGGDLGGTYPNPTVTDLTIASEAQGDILYRNATNWVRLAAGTAGQVLQTNGTGANPTWETAGGGTSIGKVIAISAGYAFP